MATTHTLAMVAAAAQDLDDIGATMPIREARDFVSDSALDRAGWTRLEVRNAICAAAERRDFLEPAAGNRIRRHELSSAIQRARHGA